MLLPRVPSFAAKRGDAFDESLPAIGGDRRNDDPVRGVRGLECPAIFFIGLARRQDRAEDGFPRIGSAILDGALCAAPLVAGEQMREGERDDRPFGILFI